ncbi:uncharacterized protein BTUAT1_25570 [Bacillus altitudinis]|nr:uncharacterized protein BTUAT1_25570 [Bacillus pumilus]
MQCIYCKDETSFTTINHDYICEPCAISKKHEVCTKCGNYFVIGSSNSSSCTSCEEKGLD